MDMEEEGRREGEDEDEEEEEEVQVEDEEGEGEEENDDEEGEEGYALRFSEGTDPMDLFQQNSDGVELYRRFEQLEYEALAERKRKAALDDTGTGGRSAKKPRSEELLGVTMEEINELMDFGSRRRRSRRRNENKKRGRKKGSRNKLSPEVTRKIGDATLHFASGDYDEAIPLLEEVVRLAPNLFDAYHMLGMISEAKGDRKRALNFYMIAAHLSPKDPSIWKKLIAWSIAAKNSGQMRYCLSKAISADPKDVGLRFDLALLHFELGEYQKAAESYDQIVGICPSSVEARKMAAKMYKKCGQLERAISVLADHDSGYCSESDRSLVNLLIALYMENNSYKDALDLIKIARSAFSSSEELPLYIKAKEAICHAHLGNMEYSEALLQDIQGELDVEDAGFIVEVADSFSNVGKYEYALKFYLKMVDHVADDNNLHGILQLKIAQCFMSLKESRKAVPFYYRALCRMEDNIDIRITISSLLLEEGRDDEAISVLSPPKSSERSCDTSSAQSEGWWQNGNIKLQLAKIYHKKGMLEDFANTIHSYICKTLTVEIENRRFRPAKKLTKSVLSERAKLLDEPLMENVFPSFRPVARPSELLKATRAKKSLQKMAALKEEKKAASAAAGLDLQSDSEGEIIPKTRQEPPLPGFLKDNEHCELILDLCKALASLQKFSDALKLINLTLKLENNANISEKKEEFRSLGAQITYRTRDPTHGYNYIKHFVKQHPYSMAAWNCYYKVVSRFENRFSGHSKFIHRTRVALKDCIMPMIITGNHFTATCRHQEAASEYLEAYKVQPDNPLVNLCAATALINLTLGVRLKNKHYCVAQGLAFLYNYLHICDNSQEALYNIARAYQHVGLVTLAVIYYEKVLALSEEDSPIPKLPYEDPGGPLDKKSGYCDLKREAAYNLHLIYKNSGATDLARQVLKNYCTL